MEPRERRPCNKRLCCKVRPCNKLRKFLRPCNKLQISDDFQLWHGNDQTLQQQQKNLSQKKRNLSQKNLSKILSRIITRSRSALTSKISSVTAGRRTGGRGSPQKIAKEEQSKSKLTTFSPYISKTRSYRSQKICSRSKKSAPQDCSRAGVESTCSGALSRQKRHRRIHRPSRFSALSPLPANLQQNNDDNTRDEHSYIIIAKL